MNFCFISGFSQNALSLERLGKSINIPGQRLYLSPEKLTGKQPYLENLHEIIKDIDNLVLVAWSLGGTIALEYAVKYSEKVKALIVISGTSCYLTQAGNIAGIEPERMQALIKGVVNTKKQSLKRFISLLCSPDTDQSFNRCYLEALSVPSEILVHNLEYYKADFRQICSEIKCPLLVVHDSDDRVVPLAQGQLLSELVVGGARKFITSGQGHLLHHRQPELVAREIEKFLEKFLSVKLVSVESSFSRAANTYDQNSEIQRKIADNLMHFIPENISPASILDLGTGTGYLASAVKERFPDAEITINDISPEMIEVAKNKLGAVQSFCGDFKDLLGISKIDLIVSSAALHWANSFDEVIKKLHQILNPNGLLAISLMLDGTLFELRSLRQEVAPKKKQFPILNELEYFKSEIEKNGFDIIKTEIFDEKIYFKSFDQLINSIKKTGVTGGNTDRLTSDEFRKLKELYIQKYNQAQLTYKAGLILATKKI